MLTPLVTALSSLIVFALLIVSASAAATAENQKNLQVLTEMTTVLKNLDLVSFVKTSAALDWRTPKMFSAWYIERLPDDNSGVKAVERAKSEFGLALAKKMTEHANLVRREQDSTRLETLNEPLFSLVDWLGKERGYGNMILQARAYDIASVATVKWIADLHYPLEKAETAFNRFDWKWCDAEGRRQVLCEESGFAHFKKSLLLDIQAAMDEEWGKKFIATQPDDYLDTKRDLGIIVYQEIPAGASAALPETVWQIRLHRLFVSGWDSVNLRNLKGLLVFRKRYGRFPVKPIKYQKQKGESEIQAAFWEVAWKDYRDVDGGWVVYSQYLDGTLADEGERQSRLSPALPR